MSTDINKRFYDGIVPLGSLQPATAGIGIPLSQNIGSTETSEFFHGAVRDVVLSVPTGDIIFIVTRVPSGYVNEFSKNNDDTILGMITGPANLVHMADLLGPSVINLNEVGIDAGSTGDFCYAYAIR